MMISAAISIHLISLLSLPGTCSNLLEHWIDHHNNSCISKSFFYFEVFFTLANWFVRVTRIHTSAKNYLYLV